MLIRFMINPRSLIFCQDTMLPVWISISGPFPGRVPISMLLANTHIFLYLFLSCSWLRKHIPSSPHYLLFNQLVTFAKIVRGGVGN